MSVLRKMNCLVIIAFTFLWSYGCSSCVTPLGQTSECVQIYDCAELWDELQQKPMPDNVRIFLGKSHCGFLGKVPKVCCGPVPSELTTTPASAVPYSTVPYRTVDPVEQEDSYPMPGDQCGTEIFQNRIVGGQATNLDEFPWMALLMFLHVEMFESYQCGGVLINHRYVLSAAHCVVGKNETIYGKLNSVVLGEYNISSVKDCIGSICTEPVQKIAVNVAFPHPGFSGENSNRKDDIMLIRLAQRARFTSFVQPICLPSNNVQDLEIGDIAYVAGWGQTLTEFFSPIKLKLGLPIFSKTECNEKFRNIGIELTDKQVCAGGLMAQDACLGDSGGSLMRSIARPWETVAVVSFGNGCGKAGWPAVYTSVFSYRDWIEETMRSSNVWISPDTKLKVHNHTTHYHNDHTHDYHNHTHNNHTHTHNYHNHNN